MDTSSAKQDEVDIGRDGADGVGGTEPRPRGHLPLAEAARQLAAAEQSRDHEDSRRGRTKKSRPGRGRLISIRMAGRP